MVLCFFSVSPPNVVFARMAEAACSCDAVPEYFLIAYVASTSVLFLLILCLGVGVVLLHRKSGKVAPLAQQSSSTRLHGWSGSRRSKAHRPSDAVSNSTLLEVVDELRREIDALRRHELGHDFSGQPQQRSSRMPRKGSDPRLADGTDRSATHTLEPCLGQTATGGATARSARPSSAST